MANILSLALKINADASGLRLTPVERALQRLGAETDKVTSVFDKFAGTSEVAARAQADTAKAIADLTKARQAGTLSAEQFAEEFQKVRDAALEEAAALQRAAQITEANLTPLQRYDRSLEELNSQLQAGRISQETYGRAVESSAKGLTDAERAARGLAVQQKEIDTAAGNTTLKFNELSGVFSVLPGPLGNIAGRISGIASASEGLSRIFAGGLTSGISNLAASFTQLINPVTAALAGLTAVATLGPRLASALDAFESRVERLGNQANQLGVSFDFIQVVEETARRSGVSVGSLEGAFTRLQRTVTEAGDGTKTAVDAFARLGLTVADLDLLNEEEQFRLIGQRIAAIEDPALRTAAAVEIFGRSGAQLLPFFNNLPQASEDVEQLGRALTAIDKERIDAFGLSVDQLVVATQGLGQTLLLPFVEFADGIAVALAEVAAAITDVVDPIGQLFAPALSQIGSLLEVVGTAIAGAIRIFGRLAEIIAPIGQFLLPAIVAQFVALRAVAIAGVISSIAQGFVAASAAAIAYATSAGTATGATIALGAAIRGLLASTGIGAFVVGAGLAANALFGWFSSADEAADGMGKVEDSTKTAADEAARLAEELAKEDAALAESAAKAVEDVRGKLSEAIDASAEFGQAGFDAAVQYQTAIADLEKQLDRGIINEETFRRQSEVARQAYDDQIAIAEQAAARIEENTRRVDGLLAKANEIPKIEQDLNAIDSEIARVEAELAAARESDATAQADALTARLAQLDQLQAGLLQQQDEAAQGFAQGFDAAFASVDSGINSLIDKAGEFGNEGAIAAQQLADGIAAAREQVRDGILSKPAFDAEVARQKELFEDRLADLRQLEQINNRIAEGEAAIRDRQFEIELARAEELANVRTGSVEINDIRSGGISAFFDTLNEDPAIAEAKKQTKELERLRKEIEKLNADKVDILAGTG